MPSSHLILCHPLLLPPSIFPSIRVFSSESVLRIRWPKYWVTVGNWCINTGEKQTIQSRTWLRDFRRGHRKIYCIGILIFFFSCRYLKNSKCKERCLQTLLICLKKMSLTCLKTDPPKKKLQCHEFLPQASYQLGKTDSSQEMKLEVKTTCRQMCHKLSHIVF